jgi:hypothetical protein
MPRLLLHKFVNFGRDGLFPEVIVDYMRHDVAYVAPPLPGAVQSTAIHYGRRLAGIYITSRSRAAPSRCSSLPRIRALGLTGTPDTDRDIACEGAASTSHENGIIDDQAVAPHDIFR